MDIGGLIVSWGSDVSSAILVGVLFAQKKIRWEGYFFFLYLAASFYQDLAATLRAVDQWRDLGGQVSSLLELSVDLKKVISDVKLGALLLGLTIVTCKLWRRRSA